MTSPRLLKGSYWAALPMLGYALKDRAVRQRCAAKTHGKISRAKLHIIPASHVEADFAGLFLMQHKDASKIKCRCLTKRIGKT